MPIPRSPEAGRLAEPRGDLGSVSLEVVVLFPAALLLVFGAIQGALWYHAKTVATAAAAAGVTAGRAEGGTVSAAVAAADSFVDRSGGAAVLRGASSSGTRNATSITVTVSGAAPQVIPGIFDPSVRQSVTGAVERVTVPGSP